MTIRSLIVSYINFSRNIMASTKIDREKAVQRALANSALEGLKPSADFRALLDQYVAGEVTLDVALENTRKKFQQASDETES
jgi:hypothetical protein